MIFNRNYDRSLWMMLSGDTVNRSKIAEVITNIPYELYEQIRKLIEFSNNERQIINYEKNNIKYDVNVTSERIFIKAIKFDDTQEETVELSLFPIAKRDLSEMELYSAMHLGSFSYELSSSHFKIDGGLEEYDVVKTVFGNCVKVYTDNRVKATNNRRVDESRMPNNIYPHQFRNQKGIKRLVRGRRK